MKTSLKYLIVFALAFPFLVYGNSSRKPSDDSASLGIRALENSSKNVQSNKLKSPEIAQNRKSFFAAMSYSLFSPTFDSDTLKNQNEESLGLSAAVGYSYLPHSGLGFQMSVGILQNSKTDRSLPDFILFKPSASVSFSVSKSLYLTGGLFNYIQQGNNLKNFQSYIGQEFFIGYKASKNVSIRFGYSYNQFTSDFILKESTVHSMVSLRGIESQLIYLF